MASNVRQNRTLEAYCCLRGSKTKSQVTSVSLPFYLSLIAEANINITNPRANRTLNEAAPTVDLPVH